MQQCLSSPKTTWNLVDNFSLLLLVLPLCIWAGHLTVKRRSNLVCCIFIITNRFHVAERLFSNRSQMTSKCGKNKKVAHEAIAECVTDVVTAGYELTKPRRRRQRERH